jgi:alkanesulfonate monooxygenase SsuD/methylene tetrahydromethanopterin reductase-like flavin-dependent oxidoreductase (luciferase family)
VKFGTVVLWRSSYQDFVEEVCAAERLGMDLVGAGDTQASYRELYVSLTVAALKTERVLVGPMVTNPVTRHPAVTMSAMGAVDRLSDGRAVMGIGTGGSAVWNVGLPPARIDDFREYLETMQSLMLRGRATYRGSEVLVEGIERPFPIFVSAEGPRALRLAGALADGVILHAGTSKEAVDWCRSRIAEGAEQAGRDPEGVELWMMLKAAVADTREEALQEVKMGLAGSAEHALRTGAAEKGVPEELLEPVAELVARYDASQHAKAGSSNGDLVDELGLTDFLADYFGLVGTPEECAARLRLLEQYGIQGVVSPALGSSPIELITRLGREVLPLVAEADPLSVG